MTSRPTADQIERAMAGERAAVEALVGAFLPRVFGLCLRMTRSRELAEDATQEAFVRVLRDLPKLREPSRFDSWTLTIAANTARNMLKKRGRDVTLSHEPAAIAKDVDTTSEARAKAIDLAVAGLKSDERELFLLHTVEGVRLKTLAREHDTTVSALKSRVHRIRSKVRADALSEMQRAEVGR